jgi:hypothetical protein
MADTNNYINTRFIITNNQTEYPVGQIWVSFAGPFINTGQNQTIGVNTVTDFTSTWRSFNLDGLSATITDVPFLENTSQYTFSLNGFSGRIYINYGASALSVAPTPSAPGNSPYIVFETTVSGLTLTTPTPTTSNMDLSYVDGISAQAATMVCSGTTGAALQATSINPVTATAGIMANVASLVPIAAQVMDGGTLVRIMSSAASPSSYHDWSSLISTLQTTTATSPLKICSYTSPLTGLPAEYALNGALFGYSGAPAISGQMPGFETMQGYTMAATFCADLNPSGNTALTGAGIITGTAGVILTGSGTVCSSFSIYITQANLNAGTGIYGSNPGYVVLYPATGASQTAYATTGIVNDLGGRIVGDLMAGMVFGWSASIVNIADHATATGTNLYGTTFSATTVGGISTGELFFLLSLAGSQVKLNSWIGQQLDSNADNYDEYLYAIALNTSAYGSGFTDRLQGYLNPDTYWYTANPPAIPGGSGNFEVVGFVNLFLGCCETAKMGITLTNNSNETLSLISSSLTGNSNAAILNLPQTLPPKSKSSSYVVPASVSPYEAIWTYSPDNGNTSLTFSCSLSGPEGITITPSMTGTYGSSWADAESPSMQDGVWVIEFIYKEIPPDSK